VKDSSEPWPRSGIGMATIFELFERPVIPCPSHSRPGLSARPGEPPRLPPGCLESGLDALRGSDPDELLDTLLVRENLLGNLFSGPVSHVNVLSLISSLLAVDQTVHKILRPYGDV
jgi:hypothetical protein